MEQDLVLTRLQKGEAQFWINPELRTAARVLPGLPLQYDDIQAAADRLARFAPLLADLFPELEKSRGMIESDLHPIGAMEAWMNRAAAGRLQGRVLLKADHDLPVAGSVKARGGIYEVLLFAENLALSKGLLSPGDDLRTLARARELFQRYTVSVGSTGNLGLSIGLTAAALGFQAVVHMSREAKQWKKERLRSHQVTVIEHAADYSTAVAAGREAARSDPANYFVDDEDSRALFLGYSVAALRLQNQLGQAGIAVDRDHPLFVYLPCGVGGAPGGITFGLKHIFGDNVHCIFAEPVQAPCMLLGLLSGFTGSLAVTAAGLELKTAADGLAVGRASGLVGRMIANLVAGVYTIDDDSLLQFLHALNAAENIRIEPSAAAGFAGPFFLCLSTPGRQWLEASQLSDRLTGATHIIWSTGGCLLPPAEFKLLDAQGSRAIPAFPDSLSG